MHTAQCAAASIEGHVAMHDARIEAMSRKFIVGKTPCEEPALIFNEVDIDDGDSWNRRVREFQSMTSRRGIATTHLPPQLLMREVSRTISSRKFHGRMRR